jgi:hypothetical protein
MPTTKKQTKQTQKQTEQEAKIVEEVENNDTEEEEEEEVENHDDDTDTDDDDDDEEYKKALLMVEMIKKKKMEKTQKKAETILNKIVNGAVYIKKHEEYEKAQKHADNLKKEMADYLETEKEANGYNLLVKTAKKSVGGGGGGGGSKSEPTTTTDIKKDLADGKHDLYSLVVNGVNYKLCYDKNIYHFGNVSVPCGKKDNKTNYILSHEYCVENKINTLNKIGNFVFGSSTNIYTKLKKI